MRRKALMMGDVPKEREAQFETLGYDRFQFALTTRKGAYTIDYQDGGSIVNGNQGVNPIRMFPNSDPRIIKLWFKNGVQDVDTIGFSSNSLALKITDIVTFCAMFPKLRVLTLQTARSIVSEIRGNVMEIENLEEIFFHETNLVNNPDKLHLNFDKTILDSKLKKIATITDIISMIPVYGDIAKIPESVAYYNINSVTYNYGVSYSGGKVWAAETDCINFQGLWFTASEKDAMLNDMAASITSAVGTKKLIIPGFRTSASDTAYSYLTGLGFDIPEAVIADANALTSADCVANAMLFSPAIALASLIYPAYPYGRQWNNLNWYIGLKPFIIFDKNDGHKVNWNANYELKIYELNSSFQIVKGTTYSGGTIRTITNPYWYIGHIRKSPSAVIDETEIALVGLVVTT